MGTQTLILALMLFVLACGKEAEESRKSMETNLTFSEAEVDFHLLKELHKSVETNDYKQLQNVLSIYKNINLNEIGHDGETLLTKAITLGHQKIVTILIDIGADINASNINGENALISATNRNNINLMKKLIELEANIEAKDIFGDSPLLIAIKKGFDDAGIILIENGADVFITDRNGRSAFTLAKSSELDRVYTAIRNKLEEKFSEPTIEDFREQIIYKEFKLLVRSLSRFSHLVLQYEEIGPLSVVAHRENEAETIEAAKLMIRWGAKINGPANSTLNSPLIESIILKKFEYANYLLSKGANSNLASRENLPPLFYAIEANHSQIVKELLIKGAESQKDIFDACAVAEDIEKDLTTATDKEENKKIRKTLRCGVYRWL